MVLIAIRHWLGISTSLALLVLSPPVMAQAALKGTVVKVVDGDTVWVHVASAAHPVKVRIQGIDAPEICQAGGAESRSALRGRLQGQSVSLFVKGRDDYDRVLARVDFEGGDSGRWMVSQGQAWSYRFRRDAGPYAAEEGRARAARLGLFRQDSPENPRSFRERHGSCYRPR